MSDAKELGNRQLSISGGEPTVYKNLTELIKIGKSHKWPVSMNTNGSLITKAYAGRLLEAGLDQVRISLYSPTPQMHGEMRSNERMWKKTLNAVRIFADLRSKYPNFSLVTQTLISRDNFRYLPELMKLHHELGSLRMHLSYLEGDFEKLYLLDEKEILELKNEVVPRAIRFCDELERPAKREASRVLKGLYDDKLNDISDYAEGVYRPESRNLAPCKIPNRQAIILANGDVHQCNMIEYSHKPVVGNVFEERFSSIWSGEKWVKFRKQFFADEPVNYCQLCPMGLHKDFRLKAKGNSKLKRGFNLILQHL